MIKNVQIGPILYTINEQEDCWQEGSNGEVIRYLGYHDSNTSEINIFSKLPPQKKGAVVIHEILHAILENAGFEGEHPEPLIDTIAYGILDLLRQNPNFVDYIYESLGLLGDFDEVAGIIGSDQT